MSQIPTVRIKDGGDGYIVINESDFNSSVHELYDGPEPKVEQIDESEEQPPEIDSDDIVHEGTQIPTVKVFNEAGDGYIVINQEDFRPDIHRVYEKRADDADKDEDPHDKKVTDFSVAELRPIIAGIGSVEVLNELLDQEKNTATPRQTVVKLLEARINQIDASKEQTEQPKE